MYERRVRVGSPSGSIGAQRKGRRRYGGSRIVLRARPFLIAPSAGRPTHGENINWVNTDPFADQLRASAGTRGGDFLICGFYVYLSAIPFIGRVAW